MFGGIVRSVPKNYSRLSRFAVVRSISSSQARLDKSHDDNNAWRDEEIFKEEPFPKPITEYNPSNSTSDMLESPAGISDVASATLRELNMSDPFDIVCSYINNIHVTCDVPYWGSIMIGTITLRLFIMPVAIRIMQNGGRLAIVQPLVKAKIDEAQKHKDDKELHAKLMSEAANVYREHKVNPLLSLVLPFVQMPLFVSFFFGLQRMGEIYPGYDTGGAMWFENLSAIDPTYILPLLNGFTFFLVFESNNELKSRQPQMMVFFRLMALFMVPITANFQSGVLVYWCTNNLVTLVQTNVLRQDAVSKFLDIPKPPPPAEGDKVSILELMKKATIEAQMKQKAAKEEKQKGDNQSSR